MREREGQIGIVDSGNGDMLCEDGLVDQKMEDWIIFSQIYHYR